MKKRNINILITIIFVASISFIIPNNVNAKEVQCNPDAAAFTCEYFVPDSGFLPEDTGEVLLSTVGGVAGSLFVLSGKATHYDLTFTYNICTDGKGGMKSDIHTWNTGSYDLDINKFVSSPYFFYNSSNYEAKCPDAFIRINNNLGIVSDSYIKIRKTKKNVIETCYACALYQVEGNLKNYNGKKFYIDQGSITSEKYNDCKAILGTEEYSLGWLIKKALLYLKLIGPILVLVLSSIDFIKAIIEGSDDSMKKAQKKLTTRLIVVVLLILIPSIVDLLLDIFGFTAAKCNL